MIKNIYPDVKDMKKKLLFWISDDLLHYCLSPSLQKKYPERWSLALDALTGYWRVMQNIFYDDEIPGILPLRKKALASGLKKPSEKRDVW